MLCNFLHGLAIASVFTLAALAAQDVEPKNETEWVDYVAVNEFGMNEVEGKVEGGG